MRQGRRVDLGQMKAHVSRRESCLKRSDGETDNVLDDVRTRAAEIVDWAIGASGLGEPWCVGPAQRPDAVRVGNRLLVVETDDSLGWLITAYAVSDDGGDAAPIAVLAEDGGDAVEMLASLIRKTGQPMTWKRERPGLYRSGEYRVGQLPTSEWYAEGPGVDQCFNHKAQAQAACDSARGAATRCCR